MIRQADMMPGADLTAGVISTLIQQGKLEEAQAMADGIVARRPEDAGAWHLKGVIARKRGDKMAAIAHFNEAIRRKPNFLQACLDLGSILEEEKKNIVPAIRTYDYITRIAPGYKEGVAKLASLRAGKAAEQAMHAWFSRGNELLAVDDAAGAVTAYQESLMARPAVPETLANLGIAQRMLGKNEEAEKTFKEALRLKPGYPDALNSLGNLYKATHRTADAIAVYSQAVSLQPDYVEAWINLGKALQETGAYSGAIEAYEKALHLNPNHLEAVGELAYRLQDMCRWEKLSGITAQIENTIRTTSYYATPFLMLLHATPEAQLINAGRWAEKRYPASVAYDVHRPLPADARGDGKLRIGYLSGDYRIHATVYLIRELFETHDRERFEIYAYSTYKDDRSAERASVVQAVDYFRDLQNLDDAAAAKAIENDGIDILVDLKGYTQNHRLRVPALRPAPIQMHYLGYPGTIGANFIDYFISDPVASPPFADAHFSEKLIRLPRSYQMNDRKRPLPTNATSRAEFGLPENAFAFCAFNQTYKLTPPVFDIWMRLLAAVPESVLWFYSTDKEAIANLKREAEARGVSGERLIPAGFAAQAAHLERYRHADLFLDTFPVCAHTTASDALWTGVPVLTMAGESFVSRVAASLLSAADLPELITETWDAYETLALELARDRERLARIRRRLEENRLSLPLFDTLSTARAIEKAYLYAAELHRRGEKPQAFSVQPDLSIL